MKYLISPHNDDETLFSSFQLQRHAEDIHVIVVYDSYVQPARGQSQCNAGVRRMETVEALRVMGIMHYPIFLGLRDDEADRIKLRDAMPNFTDQDLVIAPAFHEGGNRHHNLIAEWHQANFPSHPRYCTYDRSGKIRSSNQVPVWDWRHVGGKLRALACYQSQISIPECQHFFLSDLAEYME